MGFSKNKLRLKMKRKIRRGSSGNQERIKWWKEKIRLRSSENLLKIEWRSDEDHEEFRSGWARKQVWWSCEDWVVIRWRSDVAQVRIVKTRLFYFKRNPFSQCIFINLPSADMLTPQSLPNENNSICKEFRASGITKLKADYYFPYQ